MDDVRLLKPADACKEQIYTRLQELLPARMDRLDRDMFAGKTTEEVLGLVYMQGVAEAPDDLVMGELLAALKGGSGLRA